MRTVFGQGRIVVVSGAPCSGKSTYVTANADPGDVVVDLDRIARALSVDGAPERDYSMAVRELAWEARAAVIRRIGSVRDRRVWVIDTKPTPQARALYLRLGADVVTLDPGQEVCLQRAAVLRPHMASVIESWYAA